MIYDFRGPRRRAANENNGLGALQGHSSNFGLEPLAHAVSPKCARESDVFETSHGSWRRTERVWGEAKLAARD